SFQAATTRPARLGSFSPVIGDFDVDGKPDLAVVSNALDVIDVLLNSPTARNVAISATATAPAVNVLVATLKDYDASKNAGSFTATINWGDATAPTSGTIAADGGGGFNITGTHTYAREGSYNVTVQIADNVGNFASTTSTATVADAPLTATGQTFNAIRGAAFTTVVATFTDADPTSGAGEFSATISWGDSTNSAGTITAKPGGGFDVMGSHTYTNSGSFPVVVMIQAQGGSTATANSTANVSPPAIQFAVTDYSGSEGDGAIEITVVRVGDTTTTASVQYATSDQGSPVVCATVNGKASSRCDFTHAVGSLNFAAGESSKTFSVLVSQDSFVEGPETISLTVSSVQ
ncbi:MAG TPA: Calx-beta domain-containing protein, partial [Pyrinomonadaceae bacterium]|nr:Calx-beta domain-containing protein [Pyrinomonadaceae bacterium]